jgi:hypothetical protein
VRRCCRWRLQIRCHLQIRCQSSVIVCVSEGGKLTAGRCCAPQAMEQLQFDDLNTGISGWGATEPQVFAARLAKAMLSKSPPRSYQDGWLWQVFYLLGNFGPLWLNDLVHKVRLRLW